MAGLLIPYQIPTVEVPGSQGSPLFPSYNATAEVSDGAIVRLGSTTAGEITAAAADDDTLLLGIVQGDSSAVYQQLDTGIQGVFGADNVNTGLLPASAGQIPVALFAPPAIVAINLPATTGWISGGAHQAAVGTEVGIGLDGTTGIYYADDQAANKVAVIVAKVQGATGQINNGQTVQVSGPGGVGDLGARVYIAFIASTLAVTGSL